MVYTLKTLFVVLVISAIVFHFAKPIALEFSSEQDFLRRRNVWFALTVVGFLSPSFWIFALVTAGLAGWAARKDATPVALYLLLLHVIPPIAVEIPVVGINRLFALDNYRVLSVCILLPTVWRLRGSKPVERLPGTRLMDILLLLYGVLQISFYIRADRPDAAFMHDSLTDQLRRGVLFFIDDYLVYFAISRSCVSRRALRDVLATFCLACLILAFLALFENLRRWVLYEHVGRDWGGDIMGQFALRNDMLRATVSAGHSLALGDLFALALGFWLYLRQHVATRRVRVGVMVALIGGLIAAYSRGPWVGALVIYFAFTALGNHAVRRLLQAGLAAVLLGSALLILPIGDRIRNVIPFLGGNVDQFNIDYRHRLAERSWELIRERPFFGDQEAYSKLHDMRQGSGVIDFVNTYAQVSVFYGLVGLSLFVSFILLALGRCYRIAKMLRPVDEDLAMLGAALAACIIGSLLMIYTSSFVFAYEKMFYALAGLAAAYVSVGASQLVEHRRHIGESSRISGRDSPLPRTNVWGPR